ncbi:MAG: hypothetical protein HETSPECPRED_007945 [Heterodermia speciosa]|uniref:Rhodopsin domain-containing protein n=1 Tax=Heterodermia speciosa TaxID=116794 RepID=A0A8H3EMH5_9LECA|nr:MAG: hypothetical protein HETSPECPRED_007945 [Heterodermia speciosa]
MAAGIVIPIVGAIVVGMRFWVRSSQKSTTGADDYTILLALQSQVLRRTMVQIFVLGMGICFIYGTAKKALGYPTPPPPKDSPISYIGPKQIIVEKMVWITYCLMIPANGLIKISAILFYRRIFVVNKRTKFDTVTKISLVVMALWTIGFLLAQIFGCGTHFTYPWSALVFVQKCHTNTRIDALMISNLITDVFVWLLPMPIIWGLHMSISKKISITSIFLLAAVSLIAAIVRLVLKVEISHNGYGSRSDVNLTLSTVLYWSIIESGLALIAASLPTLHSLVARFSLRAIWARVSSLGPLRVSGRDGSGAGKEGGGRETLSLGEGGRGG